MGVSLETSSVGDHPLSKGDSDVGGRAMVSEEVKKFRARVTEPHLEQLM